MRMFSGVRRFFKDQNKYMFYMRIQTLTLLTIISDFKLRKKDLCNQRSLTRYVHVRNSYPVWNKLVSLSDHRGIPSTEAETSQDTTQ